MSIYSSLNPPISQASPSVIEAYQNSRVWGTSGDMSLYDAGRYLRQMACHHVSISLTADRTPCSQLVFSVPATTVEGWNPGMWWTITHKSRMETTSGSTWWPTDDRTWLIASIRDRGDGDVIVTAISADRIMQAACPWEGATVWSYGTSSGPYILTTALTRLESERTLISGLGNISITSDIIIPTTDPNWTTLCNLPIGPGDNVLQYVQTVATITGRMIAAKTGGRYGIRVEAPQSETSYLTLPAEKSRVDRSVDDWACALHIRVEWNHAGEEKSYVLRIGTNGYYHEAHQMTMRATPPIPSAADGGLTSSWPPAQALLSIMKRRRWQRTTTARWCPWLHPGHIVNFAGVTNAPLPEKVISIEADVDAGLMDVVTRPLPIATWNDHYRIIPRRRIKDWANVRLSSQKFSLVNGTP